MLVNDEPLAFVLLQNIGEAKGHISDLAGVISHCPVVHAISVSERTYNFDSHIQGIGARRPGKGSEEYLVVFSIGSDSYVLSRWECIKSEPPRLS